MLPGFLQILPPSPVPDSPVLSGISGIFVISKKRRPFLYQNSTSVIGSEAYWTRQAVARSLSVPNRQALSLALPLFCPQIDFLPFNIEHL